MMQASRELPPPCSTPGEVGQTCHVNKAAAIPNKCHQPAGPALEERTCCHCTTEKPTATTTGIASTSAAIRIEAELVTMPATSSATNAPNTTSHPATPPAHGSASTEREARASAIDGCKHVVHTHVGYGFARLDMRPPFPHIAGCTPESGFTREWHR